MSWLLFLDESGHDHRNTPYEVRGGVAIHAGKLWSFIRGWKDLERNAFGTEFSDLKGAKILKKDVFKWAR